MEKIEIGGERLYHGDNELFDAISRLDDDEVALIGRLAESLAEEEEEEDDDRVKPVNPGTVRHRVLTVVSAVGMAVTAPHLEHVLDAAASPVLSKLATDGYLARQRSSFPESRHQYVVALRGQDCLDGIGPADIDDVDVAAIVTQILDGASPSPEEFDDLPAGFLRVRDRGTGDADHVRSLVSESIDRGRDGGIDDAE